MNSEPYLWTLVIANQRADDRAHGGRNNARLLSNETQTNERTEDCCQDNRKSSREIFPIKVQFLNSLTGATQGDRLEGFFDDWP